MTERMCVCGHAADEHHRSWLKGGFELLEECEAHGSNETGGMEFVDGKYVEHCWHFQDDVE